MTSILNHVAVVLVLAVVAAVLLPYLDLGHVTTWFSIKRHLVAQHVVARGTAPIQTSLQSQSLSSSTGIGHSKEELVLLLCVRLC